MGRVHIDGMRPVAAVREPVRLACARACSPTRRPRFRELRTTPLPALRRAEKRHNPRMVFPAP
ncbi:hypothetical protein AB0D34_32045 [Streptomyces sp. NPDC048420]|uniref:hypothetical protein n=1 Tax=Streptomyces sp. NPDC048420 TaxID=3155755 RepID=UPI0034252C16